MKRNILWNIEAHFFKIIIIASVIWGNYSTEMDDISKCMQLSMKDFQWNMPYPLLQ